jgi:hypothetical protein
VSRETPISSREITFLVNLDEALVSVDEIGFSRDPKMGSVARKIVSGDASGAAIATLTGKRASERVSLDETERSRD